MDPIKQEQQRIADHICARLNDGVPYETLLVAFNTMVLDALPQQDQDAGKALH